MGTFVTGGAPLPPQKADAYPSQNPSIEIDAADVNNLWAAADDLRTHTSGYVNVKEYGAKGDGTTDDTAAIQAALNAVAPTQGIVILPPTASTYAFASTLTWPDGVTIVGMGRVRSILRYTGSGTAIASSTPGTRVYNVAMRDLKLYTTTGAIGFDLDSVSSADFTRVDVQGFSNVAFYIHSGVVGGAVYNTFYKTTATACGTGYRVLGEDQSSPGTFRGNNGHDFISARAVNCSVRGWDIRDVNDVTVINGRAELCGVGFYLDSQGAALADNNRLIAPRAESCTTAILINTVNVRYTLIEGAWFGSNGTDITDNAVTTRRAGLLLSAKTANSIVALDAGWQFASGAGVVLGTSSSSVQAATGAPLYLRGQGSDAAGSVGAWIGNSTTLTTAGAKAVAFSADSPVTHATEVASIRKNASTWGLRLKSPDGTWYLLTIANGGTVSIAADP